MKIIAIETSCDETAIALVEASGGLKSPKFKILKDFVASQIKIHQPFGGVVPNIAKREHLRNLPILIGKILGISNFQFLISNKIPNSKFQILNTIDLVAVTVGPGLEPALWAGVNFAKQIYAEIRGNNKRRKPQKIGLQGVSHLDGHLYSLLLQQKNIDYKKLFPAISLIVSGGHTMIVLMKDLKTIKKIGETRDDAVGEAFDKVARLLDLPYPGGPEIEKLAKNGNPDAIKFPRPMLDQQNFDFSYSGLKTSVLYYLRDHKLAEGKMENGEWEKQKADVAASFQKAAFDVLIKKTLKAAEKYKAKTIMISGGVAANKSLKKAFIAELRGLKRGTTRKEALQLIVTKFPTDNAVMIAAAAYINHLRKKKYKLVANGNLNIK